MCPSCGGRATVLPGCAYAEEDLPLFQDVAGCFDAAELTVAEAATLTFALDTQDGRREAVELLAAWVEYVPGLSRFQPVLLSHPHKLRPALSMLGTLLAERALDRISSVRPQQASKH
ncbi:MAG: hypothetical protein EOO73_11140 [Myxococcales bacterium]|nr:MAG: hypothetical protein EOO73_11140 [Myxococcales bacterium]